MSDPLTPQDDGATGLNPEEREGLIPSYITIRSLTRINNGEYRTTGKNIGIDEVGIFTNSLSARDGIQIVCGSGSAVAMKQVLIELLGYPRYLVLDEVNIAECPHHGYYDDTDSRCNNCEVGEECRWLSDNEAFIALTRRSVEDLIEALEFAIGYTAFRVDSHNAIACVCETCDWLREARRFLKQHSFEQRTDQTTPPAKDHERRGLRR